MSVNKVILVGNVGKDPEVRQLTNDSQVANFSLATSETYKNKNGEKVTQTEWHNITAFGKLVDIIEMFVKKGSQLYLEGKIKTRSWDDKDGNKRYTTEIVLDQFTGVLRMLGKQESKGEVDNSPETTEEDVTDNLPF